MKRDDINYYCQLPEEIIAVIKEEIKKQKGSYNENAALTNDLTDGGFNWKDSSQGFDFWHYVLSQRKFNCFFERYPKPVAKLEEDFEVVTKFTSVPDANDVKVGDKFKVVSAITLSGDLEIRYFNEIGIKVEDIVILVHNDNSCCPKFQIPNGEQLYIDWGCLAPYQEVKKERKQKSVKLNTKKDESSFNLFIPGVSPAITSGTTCRGTAIYCSGKEESMGS